MKFTRRQYSVQQGSVRRGYSPVDVSRGPGGHAVRRVSARLLGGHLHRRLRAERRVQPEPRLAGDVLLGRAVFRLPALPARRPRAHVLPLRLADDCQAIAQLGRGERSPLHGTLQSSRRRRHTARVPGGRPVATAGRPRPGDGRAAGRRRRRTVQVPRGGAPRNHGRGRAGAAETAGGSDVAAASLTGAGHRAITGPDPGECGSGAGPPWVDHGPQGGQRAGPGK